MATHPKVGGSDQKKEERQLNFVEMVRSGRSEGTTNSHQLAWEAMATLDSIAVWAHPPWYVHQMADPPCHGGEEQRGGKWENQFHRGCPPGGG